MNRSNELPMLEAALCYAARGWFVFPVPPGEKKSHKSAEHSGGRKWGKTSDPAEIERDWQRWPDANVGIATGPESGFFVVEADTKEGHEVDGIASLARLETQHGQMPKTLMAENPSGSLHFYFKYPTDSSKITNSASKIAPGIDVRGDGGMARYLSVDEIQQLTTPSLVIENDEPMTVVDDDDDRAAGTYSAGLDP